MLTVSLHAIRIYAAHGLYTGEADWGNTFEVDVDVNVPASPGSDWPFVDYSVVHALVKDVFGDTVPLLEDLVKAIYTRLKITFPFAERIRVAVRKMNPPMGGSVAWSQVCFEG